MLVLLTRRGLDAASRAGAALRDALGAPGAACSLIDADGGLEVSPTGAVVGGDALARTLSLADPAADALHAAGVARVVCTVPAGLEPHAGLLAHRLARTHDCRCFRVEAPAEGADMRAWAREMAARLVSGDARLEVEPRRPVVPRIETPRLVLTGPTPAHSRSFYDAIVGTAMFDTLLWDGPSSVEDLLNSRASMLRQWSKGREGNAHFAIIDRATDTQIGGCSWRPKAGDPDRGDIGYTLAPAWHGHGLGTEAIGALLEWTFATRAPKLVTADVFVGNVASRRLLEKLGFEHVGTVPAGAPKRGGRRDEWLMVLTPQRWAEWRSRRGA